MGDDRQTYSGWVRAWECDTTEHFTVAYYYQRFSQATHWLLLEMGWDFKEQRFPASTDCYTRFHQELNHGQQHLLQLVEPSEPHHRHHLHQE